MSATTAPRPQSPRQHRAQQKREQERLAWGSLRAVLREVFDLEGVLRGRTAPSELTGLPSLAAALALVLMRMACNTVGLRLSQQMAEVMYTRDMRSFYRLLLRSVMFRFTYDSMFYPVREVLQQRTALAWRRRLLTRLHDRYFDPAAMPYCRQQLLPNAVADPEDRLAMDVTRACSSVTNVVFSLVISVPLCAQSWWLLGARTHPLYVLTTFAYTWAQLAAREAFLPGLTHGSVSGQISRTSAEFRAAHTALLEQDGTAAAAAAQGPARPEVMDVRARWDDLHRIWNRMIWVNQLGAVGQQVFFHHPMASGLVNAMDLLVHTPFLRAGHALRPLAAATTEQGIASNAAMIGSMSLQRQLLMDSIERMRDISQMPRMVMSSSGTLNRVASLLAVVRPEQYAQGIRRGPSFGGSPPAAADAILSLTNAEITTPSGESLARGVTLRVPRNGTNNLLLVGGPGVGKTAILRVLKGLWPVHGGRTGPARERFLVMPTVPYMLRGAPLQAQVTYPQTAAAVPQAELRSLLEMVGLGHLLEQEAAALQRGVSVDWHRVLSLQEQQRLACCRLFFLRPHFCALDECTSAIEDDGFDAQLHARLRGLGISVITVARSAQLQRKGFHGQTLFLSDAEPYEPPPPDPPPPRSSSASSELQDGLVADRVSPKTSTLRRLTMILCILFPQLSVFDRGCQLILGTVLLMVTSVTVQSRLLTSIPGLLQGLAMQGDAAGYVKLSALALVARAAGMGVDLGLDWINAKMAQHWSSVLIGSIHERYLDGRYFAVKHLDKRVGDADTIISREAIDVCEKLAKLLKGGAGMNFGGGGLSILQSYRGGGMAVGMIRPVYEAIYMTVLLVRIKLPREALVAMWAFGFGTILCIKFLAPDFSRFAAETEKSEGEFRAVHSRTKTCAEGIAFSNGGAPERVAAEEKMEAMLALQRAFVRQRGLWGPIDHFLRWGAPGQVQSFLRMMWANRYGSDDKVMSTAGGTDINATGTYISSLIMRSFQTYYSVFAMHEELGYLAGVVGRVSDLLLVLEDPDLARDWSRHKNSLSGAQVA
jgi:ABC-type uncharacterized transport system fused permease/ATPase subunit